MRPLNKKERSLFITDYIRTFTWIFIVVCIFYLTGFYYFKDYFFAIYVFLVLIGFAFSLYFFYYEIKDFKSLLATQLKGKELIPFTICFSLINILLIFSHIFFFGELYNNFALTIVFVSLIATTSIYCGFYYYHIDKKLKFYYEEIFKNSFIANNINPEKPRNSYYDKKHQLDKEISSILLYEIIYLIGLISAALSSTLFAHFYAQETEELLASIFIFPLLVFLFFVPIPITIFKKNQKIQKTYTFLNIYHVFYQYLVFLITPFIYGSLENPNFGYTFIFIIMIFIVEIHTFMLVTNKEDELVPLAKKIRN